MCAALWLLASPAGCRPGTSVTRPSTPYSWPGSKAETVLHFFTLVSFTPVMALSGMALCIQVQRIPRPWQRATHTALHGRPALRLCVPACALPLGISGFLLYWLDLPPAREDFFRHAPASLSVSSSTKPMIYFLVGSGGAA